MKLRFVLLLTLCIGSFSKMNAQIRLDPFYPYSKWSVGIGAGFSTIYGNLDHSNSEPVYRISVQRNTNMWVALDLQYQIGALSDYAVRKSWTNGLSVYNQIRTVDLNAKVSLGEFFKYPKSFFAKQLFGLYGGIGIGYMTNNVSNITLKFRTLDKYTINDYNKTNIKRTSENFYIPYTVGFNLHMTKRVIFNINYQFCYAFSDYLDGYNFQAPTATNKYNDMYSVLSFGINYYVGKVGFHYKKWGKKG